MSTRTTTLTPEQTARFSVEYADLLRLSGAQLDEHKAWLLHELTAINPMELGLSPDAYEALRVAVRDVMLEVVRVEPRAEASIISVVYAYPDMLYAFLARTDLPETLTAALRGGIPLDA